MLRKKVSVLFFIVCATSLYGASYVEFREPIPNEVLMELISARSLRHTAAALEKLAKASPHFRKFLQENAREVHHALLRKGNISTPALAQEELVEVGRMGTGDEARLIIDTLLEGGAQINKQNKAGNTPLSMAISQNPEVAFLLLDYGADVNQTDKVGETPLMLAVSEKLPEDIIRLLLAKGAKVNQQEEQGYTALHAAVLRNNRNLVKLLVEHGADKTIKNNAGKTALDYAREREYKDIVELLSETGSQEKKLKTGE